MTARRATGVWGQMLIFKDTLDNCLVIRLGPTVRSRTNNSTLSFPAQIQVRRNAIEAALRADIRVLTGSTD